MTAPAAGNAAGAPAKPDGETQSGMAQQMQAMRAMHARMMDHMAMTTSESPKPDAPK